MDPFRDEHSQTRKRSQPQKPLLGGLYFSDLIVVAFFYAVNLLRTCGIAELVDVAFKAFAYVCTRLPFDFYQRWSLSRPSSASHSWYAPVTNSSSSATERSDSSQSTVRPDDFIGKSKAAAAARSNYASSTAVSAVVSSSDEEFASQDEADDDTQLSPFHHLTLLLVRFACTSFPHLVPRVLFAEETIGPLVRWRTGGGAAGIVREFTGDQTSPKSASAKSALLHPPARNDAPRTSASTATSSDKHKPRPTPSQNYTRPGFRAFWIGADAHVPVEVRRSDPSSKSASTLLYLHGGGFSLGSVAFYAEALIRIITKVCAMEDRDNDARCVAVEYDLGPTSRFPGPLLQCLRCYAHLIEVEGIDPASITIAGDSAGGNLTMAMLLCLDGQARGDAGLGERDWSALPMPGKAVLISPWADLRPSASLAFAPLREAAAAERSASHQPGSPSRGKNNTRSNDAKASASLVSAWTEAIGQHEWDYVAAEALMHFAQLYAGVLKTPRRVRGPMGWVAHMCAVLAGDEEDSSAMEGKPATSKTAPMGVTAPLNILRSLLPQRVARVAHSMLTEPLLNRGGATSKTPFSSKTRPPSDALNRIEQVRPSVVGALDPIFPSTERKTDAVPSTADLYIPIWQDSNDGVAQEKAKRDASDPDFEAAKTLLETSHLINPATGDWSRIKLKRGMLVTWGDRERLADDIEVWIDHVRQSQSTRSARGGAESASDDQPGQDMDLSQRATSSDTSKQTLQERRAASRSPHRLAQELADDGADWLCTAVEHGPGGVHAWPFVSMYLAGAEEEREKGLEIIARFIAEPTPSPASTLPPTPSSPIVPLAVQMPVRHDQRYTAAAANSPPHLNAVSPAGSMPSDISSRGDDEETDDAFLGSSYTDSEEGWDADDRNELGLEGVYPHETVWTQPTPTPSTGAGTPLDSDVEQESIGHDELIHRVGLGLGSGNDVGGRETASHTMEPTLGGPSGRTLAELEAESDMSAPPSRPESPGWREDSSGYNSRDDDDLSAPSPQEIDRDAYFGGPISYADDAIPMDPGFYGLAHYHTLRPEGLSDIAEEESQFDTSSVLSSGNGGALSPGYSDPTFSPQDERSPNVSATRLGVGNQGNQGRYGAYAPSAAEMAMLREALDERERQYQQRFARGQSRRFAIEEEDDIGGDGGSDGDVDWLDMEEQRREQQQRVSSSDPPSSSAQQPSKDVTSSTTPRLRVTAEDQGSSSNVASARETDLQPPPSPARSASSQSSALDKWW
uniref:Alpha/beta hydrolase fold-3 domain-containing protein n=1 Tax=Kalmanozyma brasiliensis (strain GHG001) TaxID=1365824 RepID=V5GTC7_KALBG